MSIHLLEESGDFLEVRAHGLLTHRDYLQLVPRTKRMIRDHGKIRVLFDMSGFQGWSLGEMWDDVKFDLSHLEEVERVALVGDNSWERSLGAFCRPFTGARVRYFYRDQLLEARQWLESQPRAQSA